MTEYPSLASPAKGSVSRLSFAMNCIINLNKPGGITSHQAVEKVRRTVGMKKAGHAGTLDPLATGVLLVCVGEGTKVARFLSDLDKEYVAVVKLGEKTDTFDSQGEITEKSEGFSYEKEDMERILPRFVGAVEQTPPMFSAVKIGGKPLYKLARKGITVERQKRTVTVHEIEITGFDLPYFEMRVSCSKGTYIRSLCNDIGEIMGVGAHMTGLTRTRIGGFRIEDSITMIELEDLALLTEPGATANKRSFFSIDDGLGHLREISLTEKEFRKAKNGLPSECPDPSCLPDEYVRLRDPSGRLFAIGKVTQDFIRIERILHI
jgi:tRNA pseudouridine55 synthase